MADRYEVRLETRGITCTGTLDISRALATKQLTDAKAGLVRQLRAIPALRLIWLGSLKEDGTLYIPEPAESPKPSR